MGNKEWKQVIFKDMQTLKVNGRTYTSRGLCFNVFPFIYFYRNAYLLLIMLYKER